MGSFGCIISVLVADIDDERELLGSYDADEEAVATFDVDADADGEEQDAPQTSAWADDWEDDSDD